MKKIKKFVVKFYYTLIALTLGAYIIYNFIYGTYRNTWTQ